MGLNEVRDIDPPSDGRRRRTFDSRARIISAMIELTRAGHVIVSAEQVAEAAQVGLRTVFRHFTDMDSLYREMTEVIEMQLAQDLLLPFVSQTWRGRLAELVGRRAELFERMAPFRRAVMALRHRSRFLGEQLTRSNALLRARLIEILPPHAVDDRLLVEGLDAILSVETWERLRRDQGLSPSQARDLLADLVQRLAAQTPDP